MPTKPGHIHWNALDKTALVAASAFYNTVLGRDIVPLAASGTHGYLIRKDGETPAGACSLASPGFEVMPSHWFTHVGVADLDAALAAVDAAGGTVVRPAIAVQTAGWFGVIQDLIGAFLDLIQTEGNFAEA